MTDEIMSEVVSKSEDGFEQIRLTVNEFRGMQYLHLRKYYLSFEEEWLPTSNGIAIPITLSNVVNLFDALTKMLSRSDVLHLVLENADKQTRKLIHDTIARRIDEESESELLQGDTIPF